MAPTRLDTALPAGIDAREYARLLHRVHEATLSGSAPPARLRPVIEESWQRMRRHRIDPDHCKPAMALRREEVQRHRNDSPLADLMPLLRQSLVPVAEDAGHVMVVADDKGRVLWRDGPREISRVADGAGLIVGAAWDEGSAGTNAIGTALMVGRPVQVYSAEHYVRGLHSLTCACAPIRDPRDGRLVGAIDVSGPASTAHPSTLALVDAVARLAESRLRCMHHAHLERLRSVAAPLLAGMSEKALVVDDEGWTAAVANMEPVRRIPLPKRGGHDRVWLPKLGECRMEPLPGGWLVRPTDAECAPAMRACLDLTSPPAATITVGGPSGEWTQRLTVRHAELLFLLARHPDGRSAAQLAADLFGDEDRVVTVRAEMSRLRRHLGGIVASRPYRFSENVDVTVRAPRDAMDLMPTSHAPGIRRARADLDPGEDLIPG
ncbi:hypothetical protein HNR23_001590 [Nocardiopsis mwathae]|uniref:OmpR/PhoB-type domain-containing protein n=1 Tax=Nocardiopsis mwathae TaxID=1472723 RepID=A0A7X0D4V8_9ACTN|nr:hypothetical protein [Nocardiopsis mwathae]